MYFFYIKNVARCAGGAVVASPTKKFLALKEAKAYRTEEGLKEMERVVLGMNNGRVHSFAQAGKSRRKIL